jgi:hypothetical protein
MSKDIAQPVERDFYISEYTTGRCLICLHPVRRYGHIDIGKPFTKMYCDYCKEETNHTDVKHVSEKIYYK